MNALFIANLQLSETEGIFKKVCAESDAVGHVVGSCQLVTRRGDKAVVKLQDELEQNLQEVSFFEYINKVIDSGNVELFYIRHMIPSPALIRMLKKAKDKKIRIYYEIPTYPYFAEQFRTSRKKYRAVAKIVLDVIFWPLIYLYIDKLVVIRSNTKSKTYSKMIEITNGVGITNIKEKNYDNRKDDNCFRMVAVGTLYPYHGYDRVLKGLAECKERVDGKKVEFHVIGASQTIDELQMMSNSLGLNNVFFHGIKTTDQLNEMYDQFNVGLGCMALHRRNADIDTTLKIIEYYCRGIPVISTGKCPLVDEKFSCIVEDNEDAVNISKIYQYYCGLTTEELKTISGIAKKQFLWESIMRNCLIDMQD